MRAKNMSRKMTKYSTEFKTKIVLEVLQGNKTLLLHQQTKSILKQRNAKIVL